MRGRLGIMALAAAYGAAGSVVRLYGLDGRLEWEWEARREGEGLPARRETGAYGALPLD